ncbi:MAG: hypothetical protein O3A51_00120 [Verrucomicrobia bacterium]|nr:hypothetical protein [Verrucomicrobiota bacterium]
MRDQKLTVADWSKRSLMILLIGDVILLVLHVCFGWSVINLDEEGNLSAWYSSAKLLSLAILATWIWAADCRYAGRWHWPWLLVALIFLGLSADETASLHERLARLVMQESSAGLDLRETVLGGDTAKDSYAWVILLSPFILAVTLFFGVFFVKRLLTCRLSLVTAISALAFFLLAVALEATIYAAPSLADWGDADVTRYRLFLAIEESGELLGSTLFIFAFLTYGRSLLMGTARVEGP